MLATVDDVAAVSRDVPDADQARVTRLIELVSARVQRYTGQTIEAVADDVVTITPHDGDLRLPQRPVTAISSIVVRGDTLDPTLYTFTAGGVVRRTAPGTAGAGAFGISSGWPASGEWPWPPLATIVTYDHGYATIPDDLVSVVAELAAQSWLGGDRAAEGKIGESIDGYSESWYRRASPTTAWDPAHKAILDSYRRAGFASLRTG
jgi:hypothetical protein